MHQSLLHISNTWQCGNSQTWGESFLSSRLSSESTFPNFLQYTEQKGSKTSSIKAWRKRRLSPSENLGKFFSWWWLSKIMCRFLFPEKLKVLLFNLSVQKELVQSTFQRQGMNYCPKAKCPNGRRFSHSQENITDCPMQIGGMSLKYPIA